MLAAPVMRETLSPEYAFLVDALTPGVAANPDSGTWDRARWDRLLQLAHFHRLAPMVFDHVGLDGPAPAHVTAALERAYIANGTRNLFISASLDRILKALSDADVPVMLLKGVALIEAVYTDPALREMGDMDILVPKARLDDANAAVAGIGYGRKREITRDQDTKEWMRAHHRHDPPLVDEHQYVKLELHYHIVKGEPAAHFDVDDLWRRARTARAGRPHLLPAAEDLLLHACFHFTYHRMTTSLGALAQLADIAWILGREPIDAQALIDTARAYRVENSVFLALFAAYELGLTVPGQMLEALRPPGFNERVGRRMVALRVLRTRTEVPRRSLRKAVAPGRWGLERSWGAAPRSRLSLARAYVRRVVRSMRYVRPILKEPRTLLQDRRLNKQLESMNAGSRDAEG